MEAEHLKPRDIYNIHFCKTTRYYSYSLKIHTYTHWGNTEKDDEV